MHAGQLAESPRAVADRAGAATPLRCATGPSAEHESAPTKGSQQ